MSQTDAPKKERRNLKSVFEGLFPEAGASATIEQLVEAFGTREEVRRILSSYCSPAQTKDFVNLKFCPAVSEAEPAYYLRIDPTDAQIAERDHWQALLRPNRAKKEPPAKVVIFEKLPDGNLKLVEVDASTQAKLLAFSEEVKARAA